MNKDRIYYYDVLKTLAIYLVCIYHFGVVNYDILKNDSYLTYLNYFFLGISSVGVPLFFMVNGALLLNKSYDIQKHVRKILTIFILLILWAAITLLLLIPKFNDTYTILEFIKAIYYLEYGKINHLWFLKAIIYLYLLFPLIKALYDQNEIKLYWYLIIILILFTFGSVLLNNGLSVLSFVFSIEGFQNKNIDLFGWLNPFDLSFSYSIVYFVIGGLLVKYASNIKIKTKWLYLILSISLIILFCLGQIKTISSNIVFDTVYMGYNSIMTLLMATSIFIIISRIKITNNKFLKTYQIIGANTLGIYFIHFPIGIWLKDYYSSLPISNYLVINLTYSFLLMFLSFFIALLLKRIPYIKKLVEI